MEPLYVTAKTHAWQIGRILLIHYYKDRRQLGILVPLQKDTYASKVNIKPTEAIIGPKLIRKRTICCSSELFSTQVLLTLTSHLPFTFTFCIYFSLFTFSLSWLSFLALCLVHLI